MTGRMGEGAVTVLLQQLERGDRSAVDQLAPLLYDELRRLAQSALRRERAGHTLQPTALVNEAYLRMAGDANIKWQSRAHFFGIASMVMRRVLVQHARGRLAQKRGGGGAKVTLDGLPLAAPEREPGIIELDEALEELAAADPRRCRIVELRYFGGLTAEEMVEVVGVSTATITRELKLAQVWLRRRLQTA